MKEVAGQCLSKAHYMAEQLTSIEGIDLVYDGEFFHEFVTTCPVDKTDLLKVLQNEGILGGYPVEEGILWCATEKNTKTQIDHLIEVVRRVSK